MNRPRGRLGDRHLVGGAAAACAVCCAAPIVGFLGVAGFAATAVTLAFAGVVFAIVVGVATVAALLVRRRRARPSSCVVPPTGAGTNCGAAQDRVVRLVEEKQAEIADRVAELEQFSAQLDTVRATLEAESPPQACRADLTCCVPDSAGVPLAIELRLRH